jgi:hypothetical protein
MGHTIEMDRFTSIDELIRRISNSSVGATFLDLVEKQDGSLIWSELFRLPGHSEYDFDLKYLGVSPLKSAPSEQIRALVQALIAHRQFVVTSFEDSSSHIDSEAAFMEQNRISSRRNEPLILNFTSSLNETQIAEFGSSAEFEIVHVGLQYHCTNRTQIDKALKSGMKIIPLKKIQSDGLWSALENSVRMGFARPTWIRLNFDSLAAGQGGGAGSWPTGLHLQELISALESLVRQTDIKGVSLGPTFGLQSQDLTLKAAAQILSSLIFAYWDRKKVTELHGGKT